MLENYHYAGLIIAVASIANNIDFSYETVGEGLSRTTVYNAKSTDSNDLNLSINLNARQTHDTELQEKLYKLVEYVKNTNSKGKKVQVLNDETMFKCVVDLANAYNEKLEKLVRTTNPGELVKVVEPYVSRITNIQKKRQEIEENFLPYTREHIAYMLAEHIGFRAYAAKETVLISELKEIIADVLGKFGIDGDSIQKMYAQNKPLSSNTPPEKQ